MTAGNTALRAARKAPTPAPEPTACFSIHGRADPGIMPRVMEVFAKRGLVPSAWHSSVSEDGADLTIDLQARGMARPLADQIAAFLRGLAYVDVVLTSEKL
jgi:hypothetical protein